MGIHQTDDVLSTPPFVSVTAVQRHARSKEGEKMDQLAQYDRLLGGIYASSLEPDLWPDVLATICQGVNGDVYHLQGWDGDLGVDRLGIISCGKEEALASYQGYLGHIDPRRAEFKNGLPGPVTACHHYLDADFVRGSEFFRDYLVPHCGRYSASVPLFRAHGLQAQLDVVRASDRGPFAAAELLYLTRLAPHLRRACRVMFELQSREAQKELGQSMLDCSNLAIFGLAASRKIVQANRQGVALLTASDCLQELDGYLHAIDPGEDAALGEALQAAATRREMSCNTETSACSGQGRAYLSLVPLIPREQAPALAVQSAVALCLVAKRGGHRLASARQLMEFFGLSPAEARLARSLAHGDCLDGFAEGQGIQRCTARTQLQHALRKTRTEDQKALIRLVLSLPAVR
jgi:PAS domain-containing protein